MHYSGMYAMKSDAVIEYDGRIVLLSMITGGAIEYRVTFASSSTGASKTYRVPRRPRVWRVTRAPLPHV
ncbi:MHYT domain-containing protein [Nocardia sp. NPDC051990]|uniref:MHYT domain-containing protein n=1 Tax=Nocardia sp. NPDC051990 TaxID=3155285 RepID=UPI00342446C4